MRMRRAPGRFAPPDARALKLGPGRTLLGGSDRRNGLDRGLRADRIRRLADPGTGTRIETGIRDRLLARAEAERRSQRRSKRSGSRSAARREAHFARD